MNATSATHSAALADGADGQIKIILNVSTSGTTAVTITPANLAGGSNIVLNAAGESVICIFKSSKWYVIGGNGYTIS